MRRMRGAAIVAAITIPVLLGGCVAQKPSAETSPTRSATRSATPSATLTPTPSSADLVVSTAGLGPLKMGSPMSAASGLVSWNASACVQPDGPYEAPGEPYAGMWVPTAARTGSSTLDRSTAFGVLTKDGTEGAPLRFLQVWSSEYRTPSGVRVGSTDAEVRAALPNVAPQDNGIARWYSVVSAGWRITITVADDSGADAASGVVQLISVYPASDPDTPWWGTDVGAHCPA